MSFATCRAELSSFRFAVLTRVVFTDCTLRRADFQDADLRRARFLRCDLTGAQFSNARMDGTRFAECTLDGIGGVTSFAGAHLSGGDLIALARTLATAIGIVIDEE